MSDDFQKTTRNHTQSLGIGEDDEESAVLDCRVGEGEPVFGAGTSAHADFYYISHRTPTTVMSWVARSTA